MATVIPISTSSFPTPAVTTPGGITRFVEELPREKRLETVHQAVRRSAISGLSLTDQSTKDESRRTRQAALPEKRRRYASNCGRREHQTAADSTRLFLSQTRSQNWAAGQENSAKNCCGTVIKSVTNCYEMVMPRIASKVIDQPVIPG